MKITSQVTGEIKDLEVTVTATMAYQDWKQVQEAVRLGVKSKYHSVPNDFLKLIDRSLKRLQAEYEGEFEQEEE